MSGKRRLEDVVGSGGGGGGGGGRRSCSTAVDKALDVEVDLGNLLAVDPNPLPATLDEEEISRLSRENTQLLVNQLWKLPTEVKLGDVMAQLPKCTTRLPRAKPVPAPRPPTRWEAFAQEKGIKKRKRETSKVWDEESKSWKFSWGYRKKGTLNDINDYKLDTAMPDPPDAPRSRGGEEPPPPPPPKKKLLSKSERVAKNNLNRLRNINRRRARSFQDSVALPPPSLNRSHVPPRDVSKAALAVATASTASIGRFTAGLKHERKPRVIPVRQTAAHEDERTSFLRVFEHVKSTREKVDGDKAVKMVRREEQEAEPREKLSKGKKKRMQKGRAAHSRLPLKLLKQGGKKSRTWDGKKRGKGKPAAASS